MEYRECTIEIDDEEVTAYLHPKSAGIGFAPPEKVPLAALPLDDYGEQEAITKAKEAIDDYRD